MARQAPSHEAGTGPVAARPASRKKAVLRELSASPPPPRPQAAPFVPPTFPKRQVQITEFGAVGDALTDNGGAIQDAIDALHAKGGGTVVVPAGVWLTGRVQLRDRIRLHLDADAVLRFSDDPRRYLPPVFVRAFGQECYNYSPLIYAIDCATVGITGPGAIEGNGERWWSMSRGEARAVARLYQQVLAGTPVNDRHPATETDPIRPPLIGLVRCRDVHLDGFHIREGGPLWTTHLAYCARATLTNLRIETDQGPNNDCIVIDSCEEVLIADCALRSRDDCIALKSGLNEDGWRVGRPTRGVTIRNVRATGGGSAIAIGSEMSAGVRDVLVHDLVAEDVEHGLLLKAARGRGGVIEHVQFRDIELRRIRSDAIHLSTDHSACLSPEGSSPIIRDISLEHIRATGAKHAARIVGLPDRCIEDVVFKDVDLAGENGFQCFSAQRIHLIDTRIVARLGPAFSLRDTRGVYINGLHQPPVDRVFLDLRGRLTRDVRLTGESSHTVRPTIVLGVDVPRDAIFLD